MPCCLMVLTNLAAGLQGTEQDTIKLPQPFQINCAAVTDMEMLLQST